jgi:hypothetical protein
MLPVLQNVHAPASPALYISPVTTCTAESVTRRKQSHVRCVSFANESAIMRRQRKQRKNSRYLGNGKRRDPATATSKKERRRYGVDGADKSRYIVSAYRLMKLDTTFGRFLGCVEQPLRWHSSTAVVIYLCVSCSLTAKYWLIPTWSRSDFSNLPSKTVNFSNMICVTFHSRLILLAGFHIEFRRPRMPHSSTNVSFHIIFTCGLFGTSNRHFLFMCRGRYSARRVIAKCFQGFSKQRQLLT